MFLEQLHKVIQSYPEMFGILMFLCGALLGHWLSIGRDKRKEFNELADTIRSRFEKQAANPSIYNKTLADDVALLRHHMTRKKQQKYDKAIENYKAAIGEANHSFNAAHEVFYTNKELVAQAAQAIVNFLPRR